VNTFFNLGSINSASFKKKITFVNPNIVTKTWIHTGIKD